MQNGELPNQAVVVPLVVMLAWYIAWSNFYVLNLFNNRLFSSAVKDFGKSGWVFLIPTHQHQDNDGEKSSQL